MEPLQGVCKKQTSNGADTLPATQPFPVLPRIPDKHNTGCVHRVQEVVPCMGHREEAMANNNKVTKLSESGGGAAFQYSAVAETCDRTETGAGKAVLQVQRQRPFP